MIEGPDMLHPNCPNRFSLTNLQNLKNRALKNVSVLKSFIITLRPRFDRDLQIVYISRSGVCQLPLTFLLELRAVRLQQAQLKSGYYTRYCCVDSVGRYQVMLKHYICVSTKLFGWARHALKLPGWQLCWLQTWLDLVKHGGPTAADDAAP